MTQLIYLQIIASNFTIDPNYFFGSLIIGLLLIISFFLKQNMSKMDAMLAKHDAMLNNHENRLQLTEYKTGDNAELAKKILEKLDYLQGK